MAHEISSVSGRAEMFSVGQMPWHGLGVNVKEAQTSADAIKLAGLDWLVEQVPLHLPDGSKVPDRRANIRRRPDGGIHYLGTVGQQYQVIQNDHAFEFFDSVVGQKLAIYHTAGALKEGRKVWILAKLPGEIVVKGHDVTEKFLLLHTSHDGSTTCRMHFTPVRVVCQNTLSAATSQAGQDGVSIAHVGRVRDKVDEAVRILGIVNKRYGELEATYNRMAGTVLAHSDARDYFKKVLPAPRVATLEAEKEQELTREELWKAYRSGVGADLSFTTLWGAYNAVTEYFDHIVYRKNARRQQGEARFNSVLFGSGHVIKQRAYDLASEYLDGRGTATATITYPQQADLAEAIASGNAVADPVLAEMLAQATAILNS